jgi:hypothetical protein
MVNKASGINGDVAHKNKQASFAEREATGRSKISICLIATYGLADGLPLGIWAVAEIDHGGSATIQRKAEQGDSPNADPL